MKLGLNLLVGLSGSAWTAVVGVLATPFYLHFLGVESYGLIGFFTTLLTLVQLLDLGFSPTMNREVARQTVFADELRLRHLFRSLELLYWLVAVVLAAALLLAASWIGRYWLHSTRLRAVEVVHAVMLMALVVAARWPTALYSACLMGAQRLALVSGVTIVMVTLGALGSICILAFVSPSITAFFIWQLSISLVQLLIMRWLAWDALGGRIGAKFRTSELHRVWRFSAGVGAIAITGVMLMQFDKVLLSRMADLGSYGRYMLATLLASGIYLLATPVFNVLYPRFSALVATGQTEELKKLYGVSTRMLATLAFSLAFAVVMHAEVLIQFWTHNPLLAAQVAPIASILILAAALHALLFIQYALQLAYGEAKLALLINIVLLISYVPLSIFLTIKFSESGTAIAWLLLQCVFIGLGTFFTHRRVLRKYGSRWLFHEVGIPLCASLASVWVVGRIEPPDVVGYAGLAWTGAVIGLSTLISLSLSPGLRKSLQGSLHLKKFSA